MLCTLPEKPNKANPAGGGVSTGVGEPALKVCGNCLHCSSGMRQCGRKRDAPSPRQHRRPGWVAGGKSKPSLKVVSKRELSPLLMWCVAAWVEKRCPPLPPPPPTMPEESRGAGHKRRRAIPPPPHTHTRCSTPKSGPCTSEEQENWPHPSLRAARGELAGAMLDSSP